MGGEGEGGEDWGRDRGSRGGEKIGNLSWKCNGKKNNTLRISDFCLV